MDENNKKDNRKYIIGGVAIATLCLGIGFVVGRKYEYENDQYIWRGILKEAYDNGSTKLWWDSNDGTRSIEYVLNCVGEVSH